LYLRSVDESDAKPIAGAEDANRQPFYSPDGKWIGYQASGKLKKIPFNGGAPDILSDDVQHRGLWWNTDDTILYGHTIGGIMLISIRGKAPESVINGQLIVPGTTFALPPIRMTYIRQTWAYTPAVCGPAHPYNWLEFSDRLIQTAATG
jgi:hypothetical protein